MTSFSYTDISEPPRSNFLHQVREAIDAAGGGQFFQFSKPYLSFRDTGETLRVTALGDAIRTTKNAAAGTLSDATQAGALSIRPTWDGFGAFFEGGASQYLSVGRPWPAQFTAIVRLKSFSNGPVLGCYREDPNQRMALYMYEGGPIIRMGQGTFSNFDVSIGGALPLGADICVAFKFTGSGLFGQVNGGAIQTGTPAGALVSNTADEVWLGLANFIGAGPSGIPESSVHSLLILNSAVSDNEMTRLSNLIGFGDQIVELSIVSRTTLPNVAGTNPARSPVCTGLARHPSGSGWLVGDDGRYPGGDEFDAGIIRYDESFTSQVSRFTLASMGIGSGKHTLQGVASDDDGTFYAVARNMAGAGAVILQADAQSGALIRTMDVNAGANGLAIDTSRDEFWVLTDSYLRRRSKVDGSALSDNFEVPRISGGDHLHYLPGEQKLLVTYGVNGARGGVVVLDVSGPDPVEIDRFILNGSVAIEGVVLNGDTLYITNDAGFHPPTGGEPALNQVLTYDAAGLL